MTDVEHPVVSPKKLIEVALPLDAINAASAAEKAIRQGHPSSLHLWWARRPLVSARAVLFAQLVNDPGFQVGEGFRYGLKKQDAANERKRLFSIMEELVKWDNSNNLAVLQQAEAEIRRSWREVCALNANHPEAARLFNPDRLPGVHDPFAGGGAIPLEAQRLGLNAFGTDLNPVAVLLTKAMVEFPALFNGVRPVNPQIRSRSKLFNGEWAASSGLAADVNYYGGIVRNKVADALKNHYPLITITESMATEREELRPLVGEQCEAIAYIWAKTVRSPNPAFSEVQIPLSKSFQLSKKKGSEAWVDVVCDIESKSYEFRVTTAGPPALAETVGRKGGVCVMSKTPFPLSYIRKEAREGRLGTKLMAVAVKTKKGRVYLTPTPSIEAAGKVSLEGKCVPDAKIDHWAGCTNSVVYGLDHFSKLFTQRQLLALTCFSDAINDVKGDIVADAIASGIPNTDARLSDRGTGAQAYADAICVYLSFALDKLADLSNVLCSWEPIAQCPRHLFGRQAIPMTWDFAEANPLGSSSGSWDVCLRGLTGALEKCFVESNTSKPVGFVEQADAVSQSVSADKIICTDPPYYDNVPYSNISDFFYIWLRRTLRDTFPGLFATMAVPKAPELVANQFRHGGKDRAFDFFLDGMKNAIKNFADLSHPAFPLTIYYAFKQADSASGDTSSSGWETFLDAVLGAGLSIEGTWPLRTENATRLRGQTSNALASSVLVVCKRRVAGSAVISKREFVRLLNSVLPESLADMTRFGDSGRSPVCPVDLSQAIIGPGMAIFSKYDAVLEADGTPMTVKTALQLINRFLAEDDFDADTQFCLHWFEQCGWDAGKFGEADTLARAKGTSVDGVKDAGVIESGSGSVRLLKWKEYESDWDPTSDSRLPVWEALHQLIRAYSTGGDSGAAKVLAACASQAEAARQLAYRLYTLCERKGWAEDARAYNEVVTGWTGIEKAAVAGTASQRELFDA